MNTPNSGPGSPIEILLVEDSPSDTDLTVEALQKGKVRNHLSVVEDGVQGHGVPAPPRAVRRRAAART